MIYDSVLEMIGNTPLVRLHKIVPEGAAEVLAKVESKNPGGSIKDRAALQMVIEAERTGILRPGGTIIEPTSGNTGIALAMVGAARGYRVILVMPDTMSVERQSLMKAYGAQILLTPGELGMQGAVDLANNEAEKFGYFLPDQFSNPANPLAHVLTTSEEILRDTEGQLDAFVAAIGTGGTTCGIAAALKKRVPEVRVIGVEPASSPLLSGGVAAAHKIQGIGANFIPDNYRAESVDEILCVSDQDAFQMARRMAAREGILVGISAGANIAAALEIAIRLGPEKRVVTVLPDTGERYLSTELFKEEL